MKQVLKLVLNEFVYGGHLLSVGAAAIIYTCGMLVGTPASWGMMLVAYLFAQTAYLADRYKGLNEDESTNSVRSGHLKARARVLQFALVGAPVLALAVMAFHQRFQALVFGLLVLIYSAMYPVFKKVTRRIIGFKTLYVATGWCLLVVLFTLYEHVSMSTALVLSCLFVFIRWVMNTSLCDVKDINADSSDGLQTLAVSMGIRWLVLFLHILNLVSIAIIVVGVCFKVLPRESLGLLLMLIYGSYYLSQVSRGGLKRLFVYTTLSSMVSSYSGLLRCGWPLDFRYKGDQLG